MDQTGNDIMPEDPEQKKQSFSFGCKVSELLLSLRNIKNEQEKYRWLLEQMHISLFHTIQSAVRSNNWDAAAHNKCSFLCRDFVSSIYSQIDFVKKNADSPRTEMTIPGSFISEDVKQLLKSKPKISVAGGHKKYDVCGPLQKLILPYVFLIKSCLPMPVSLIQDKCFSGEILCKIQYFRKEKKLQPAFETSAISKLHSSEVSEIPYVIFHNLRGLQWKLYKGMAKRKEPFQIFWREANYRTFTILEEKPEKTDYILPLIFKDSIIFSVYPAYPVLRLEFKWK